MAYAAPPRRLVHNEQLQRACPIPFDEGRLWKGEHSEQLKPQLQVGRRGARLGQGGAGGGLGWAVPG